jgi:Zn-dependent peptidase ImmA (M78 family)
VSKVKPLLPEPLAAARRILAECDVQHPRDIQVEAIAARYGAMIFYGPITTAHGSITRSAKKAVIWIDQRAKGQPRADFTAAHELGHHVLHELVDHFEQCQGEEGQPPRGSTEARQTESRRRAVEREADQFSVELRMPEAWGAPLCDRPRPTLDDIDRVARTFRASFHASALRFLELTSAPCALVRTVGGKIKRSTETEAFPGRIVQTRAVHPASVAARLQTRRAGGEEGPREVPGEAWGDAGGAGFVEETIALGPELGVMSWIRPIA